MFSIKHAVGVALGLCLPLMCFAFSVNPTLLDVSLNAGASSQETVTVTNSASSDLAYNLSAEAFTVSADGHHAVFSATDPNGVVGWIHFDSKQATVKALSSLPLTFSVDVPIGTKPGEYDVAVLVSPAGGSATPDTVVQVEPNIAVLLFIAVGGPDQEKVGLVNFSMTDGKTVRDGLWGTYQFSLQNQGAVHVIPAGTITVLDFLGHPIAQGSANPSGDRLMLGATGTYSGVLPAAVPKTFFQAVQTEAKYFSFGPVTIQLELTPGLLPNQPLTGDIHVWVIPWQLLLVVVLGVGILYGAFRFLLRERKG